MRATLSLSLVLLIAPLLAAPHAAGAAAQPVEPVPAATPPAPLPAHEESLVVTATAVEEERRDVPATVRVVDGAEAAARHVESIAELLGTVAGAHAVTAGSPGQQTSLFLRGSESDQALVLWNGVPLNNPFDGAFNAAFLPAEGLERIEIAAGPFSALYGGSALGGVVQVLTARRSGVDLALEAGERAHRRAALAAGRSAGDVYAALTGHIRRGDGGLANERYASDEAAVRLEWTARPGVEAGLLGRWQEADTGLPFDALGNPSVTARFAAEELQAALPVSAVLDRWELSGTASHVRYDTAFRDPGDPFGFTSSDVESRSDRARALATRRLAAGWWAAGGEWERLETTNETVFGTNLDGARQRNRAAFAQVHLEGSRWSADLGLRRDDNDTFGGATSPRLGVAWAPSAAARLRASYGEGFRAPSMVDLFFPFTGNPGLEPERGRSAELGATLARGAWRLDAALFETRQHDLIDFEPVTFRSINVDESRSRGVEAELGWARGPLALRLGGTLLEAEDLGTGRRLKRRPEESAHLVLVARPGPATLSLAAAWVGERLDSDPHTFADAENPSYLTVDAAGTWQAREWLAPYLRVVNALDERFSPALGFPAPGRTLIGGVRVTR